MSKIFLQNEILIYFFLDSIIFFLFFISFFISFKIVKNWNYESSTSLQYSLEKKAYLIILFISFAIFSKIALFFYFVYSIDSLSSIIDGAMCAAGVFSSNNFGEPILVLKILNLLLIGIWLILNNIDLKRKDYKYTKIKFLFFLLIFIFFTIEYIVNFSFLINIPISQTVECCSLIFESSSISSKIPFALDIKNLILIFYILFILLIILAIQKKATYLLTFNLLFVFISYFSVTYFFSTYIYELPTHQCPFCMLQGEYNFIGYIIWSSLFLALFFSISTKIFEKINDINLSKLYMYSIVFNVIFVFLLSFYVVRYYILNGVLL